MGGKEVAAAKIMLSNSFLTKGQSEKNFLPYIVICVQNNCTIHLPALWQNSQEYERSYPTYGCLQIIQFKTKLACPNKAKKLKGMNEHEKKTTNATPSHKPLP